MDRKCSNRALRILSVSAFDSGCARAYCSTDVREASSEALVARARPNGCAVMELLLLSEVVRSKSLAGGASQPTFKSRSPDTTLLVFDDVTVLQKGCYVIVTWINKLVHSARSQITSFERAIQTLLT